MQPFFTIGFNVFVVNVRLSQSKTGHLILLFLNIYSKTIKNKASDQDEKKSEARPQWSKLFCICWPSRSVQPLCHPPILQMSWLPSKTKTITFLPTMPSCSSYQISPQAIHVRKIKCSKTLSAAPWLHSRKNGKTSSVAL